MRTALVWLFLVGTLTAAPVPKDFKKPDDKELFVGTWAGVGPDQVRFKFMADGTLQTWYEPNRSSVMNWTWNTVDVKATPKIARINRAESPVEGYDCVYEMTGEGMKFALILSGGRPEAVVPRNGLEFHSLTREAATK